MKVEVVAYKKGAQHNTDGTLDGSFGSGGVITADFNGLGDFGHDVTIDSQGRTGASS